MCVHVCVYGCVCVCVIACLCVCVCVRAGPGRCAGRQCPITSGREGVTDKESVWGCEAAEVRLDQSRRWGDRLTVSESPEGPDPESVALVSRVEGGSVGPTLDGPCGSQCFEENKKGIGNWKEPKSREVCLKSLIEYVVCMHVCMFASCTLLHSVQHKRWNRRFVAVL